MGAASILPDLLKRKKSGQFRGQKGAALRCDCCFFPGAKLLRCSGCQIKRYCEKDCQKAHWNAHRRDCKHYAAVGRTVVLQKLVSAADLNGSRAVVESFDADARRFQVVLVKGEKSAGRLAVKPKNTRKVGGDD